MASAYRLRIQQALVSHIYFNAGWIRTLLVTSADFPPSNTTRLKVTLAIRLVVRNGLSLAMTK